MSAYAVSRVDSSAYRAACVGRADADVLRLGDPEGVGRLGRRGGRWPGVRPRTVRFGGGRGMGGG
jgi:hypothetical protein